MSSQNVANASTAGYAEEVSSVSSRTAGGQGGGVLTGVTSRIVNNALEQNLYTSNATVSGLTTTTNALAPISALQGSTSADSGSTSTLSDAVGNLQTSLVTLESDPSDSTAQSAVVTAAGTLASNIQTTAGAYQAQRQDAQEAIVDDVSTANQALSQIGSLSNQIAQGRLNGISTADLENERAAAMNSLSNVLSVKFKETAAGDMLVTTAAGTSLPTHATTGPLVTLDATIDVSSAYPGSIPAITVNGTDVTTGLVGGTLGANITLRDQTLPTMQGELDSFSAALASRFNAQGLALFSDSSGNQAGTDPTTTAPTGQLGFSNSIQVNNVVTANPAAVRDGTTEVAGTASGTTTYTVNTSTGSANTTVIDGLLDYALGTQSADGVEQPAATTTKLGVNGTLSASYSGDQDLGSLASTLTSAQAATINQATDDLTSETAVQTSLTTKVTAVSGVSVDDEMSSMVALQNAYQANAKVVAAVQTMFTALLTAIS